MFDAAKKNYREDIPTNQDSSILESFQHYIELQHILIVLML